METVWEWKRYLYMATSAATLYESRERKAYFLGKKFRMQPYNFSFLRKSRC